MHNSQKACRPRIAAVCSSLLLTSLIHSAESRAEDGLVAWWRMEPTAGLIADSSGNGHHASIHGNPVFGTSSETGLPFIQFEGTSWLRVPDHDDLDLVGDWTVAFWSLEQHGTDNQIYLDKVFPYRDAEGGYRIWMTEDTYGVGVTHYGPNFSLMGGARPSGWNHVAVTYACGSGLLTIAINGLVVQQAIWVPMQPNVYDLWIGSSPDWNGLVNPHTMGFFSLSDLRIYSAALSTAQIRDIMGTGTGPVEPPPAPTATCDDFEDGHIDSSIWQWGGARTGVDGFGSGGWQWSHDEVDAQDGHLRIRLWGPSSGNTYGGWAWVRTRQDFNDGRNHLVNFTWGADVSAYHIDTYAIQISNDIARGVGNDMWWFFTESPGCRNLYLRTGYYAGHPPVSYGETDREPTTWSILIDSRSQTARLYAGPDLSGNIIGESPLDPGQPWYVRFIQLDATSAGFPSGDNALLLYGFCTSALDDQPPGIVCPPDVTIPTDPGQCQATDVPLGEPEVTDDGGTATVINDAPAVFPKGKTVVTWTATDMNGSSASCRQTVTVLDIEAPTLNGPADLIIPCHVEHLVPVTFPAPSVTDNCDPSPVVVFDPPSGSGFPVGATIVTCTAMDADSNRATSSFTVSRAPLGFEGFLPPIGGADASGGSFGSPLRTFKHGSTIPVKFRTSCNGTTVTSGVHRLQVLKYSDSTTSGTPIDATPRDAASTGNEFRLSDDEWHLNLDTQRTGMSQGIWLLVATLSDGSHHQAWIQIK